MTQFIRFAAAAIAMAMTSTVAAQFPVKPIKVVVSFPAGSATDTLTRVVAQPLSKSLGQPVIIENRPGADGAIGALQVVKAPPDGYTLLMGVSANLSALPALRKQPPYDPIRDFTPISLIGHYSFFVLVNPQTGINSLAELISYAKANPGKLAYATGNGTGVVGTAQIKSLAGIDMLHVPYKGEPAAVTDLISGRVNMMIGTPTTTLAFIREGKLRALATTNRTRISLAPEIPTMAEAGMPGYSMDTFAALVGPADLPKEIVDLLSREVAAAIKLPEVREAFDRQAFRYASSTPEQAAAHIRSQLEVWGKIINESGIPKD